jgi:uncharacterized lipoprotein
MQALACALLTVTLLGGCGFFNKAKHRRDVAYRHSAEGRPLEVPPDLDMPNSTGALTIPTAHAPATAAPDSAAPATAVSAPAPTGASGVELSGDGLRVADTPESTWTRVGLALERSGAARVVSSDESARSYDVEATGHATEKAGWFKRAMTFGHGGRKVARTVRLTVAVAADGDASRVTIRGEAGEAGEEAARELLKALRQRLGG